MPVQDTGTPHHDMPEHDKATQPAAGPASSTVAPPSGSTDDELIPGLQITGGAAADDVAPLQKDTSAAPVPGLIGVGSLSITGGGLNLALDPSNSFERSRNFNPHVTMGGSVHASKQLVVGPNGVRGEHSLELQASDFAPLNPAGSTAAASPVERDLTLGPEDRQGSAVPDARGGSSDGNLLGRGASGSVRLMVHLPTGVPVAVKTIPTEESRNFTEILSEVRALMEAKTAFTRALGTTGTRPSLSAVPTSDGGDAMSSGFIVDFFGAWSREGAVHIAMEAMAGSLADLTGIVPEPIAARMGKMLFTGLDVLHAQLGLLHRDIKPSNILFDASGIVKLADFGVSSKLDPAKLDVTRTFVGSVMYMSPERMEGGGYSYPSDVWAMGLTLAELVIGKNPLRQHFADVAAALGEPDTFDTSGAEGRFWKLSDLFNAAGRFDKLSAAAAEGDAKAEADLQKLASDRGFKVDDPRCPPGTGLAAMLAAAAAPDVSASFLSFIDACMKVDPERRPTAAGALDHPFLTEHCAANGDGAAQEDLFTITAWMELHVPKLISVEATRTAASDTAKRLRGETTDGDTSTPEKPADNGDDAGTLATRDDAAAAEEEEEEDLDMLMKPKMRPRGKSQKMRLQLGMLADEPDAPPPLHSTSHSPLQGASSAHVVASAAMFHDDAGEGDGSAKRRQQTAACCLCFGGTAAAASPTKPTQGAAPAQAGQQATAAPVDGKKAGGSTKKKDDGCVVI